jgi:carbamoyl-phosphate synthase/aspartate carbamoyltransferase
LKNPSDQRLFAIANALHQGYTVDRIHELTNIDRWFLFKLQNIVDMDRALATYTIHTLPTSLLKAAKVVGMSDRQVAAALGTTELAVRKIRTDSGVMPFVKQIDTVAAEFPCYTNYLYTTYSATEHDITLGNKGICVLGSGVYRIGSSVEFDWCAVRSIRTLRSAGLRTIMINYNPETVSTDYDEADCLYFENLTLERVLDIYELEKADGLIVSMGGQSPNNIALPLMRSGVNILGTSPEMIDNAENRYKFSRMLDKIGVDQPQWKELTSIDDARIFCDKVGYPVLVRPSYVLSGAAMNVVNSPADLKNFLELAANVSREFPVVISKFIEEAKEIEMDAVADGGKLIMHVVTEHIENAGVHSGDATLVLPPQDLDPETVRKIEIATRKIAIALNVTGPMNIQFIAKNNEIKVIECNLRASRSFPFVSKVLGADLIELATRAMVGLPFEAYPKVDLPKDYVAVKVPQFSFSRLSGADPVLGVEMASTGEVACFGRDKYEAYIKGLLATGFTLPKKNVLLSIGSFKEKMEFLPSALKLHQLGYNLFATAGTADFLQEHDIPVKYLDSIGENEDANGNGSEEANRAKEYSLSDALSNNLIDLYVNLPSKNRFRRPASYMSRGYRTRRMAVDRAVPLITNIKCAKLFVEALSRPTEFDVSSNDYKTSHRNVVLPGLINVANFFPGIVNGDGGVSASPAGEEYAAITKAALAGGFTLLCNSPAGVKMGAVVKDKLSLNAALNNIAKAGARCDYTLSVGAVGDNSGAVAGLTADAVSLHVGFGPECLTSISQLTAHIRSWPVESPIVASARGNDLATVLFLANLHNRRVHVTNVATKEDVVLIRMSKEKGVKLTADVAVHNLFLSKREVPESDALYQPEDVQALWDNLDIIDCFSVGTVAYDLWVSSSKTIPAPGAGLEEALPLLLSAVRDGKLTLEDIVARLYDNPRKIFDLPEQPDTYIEVEVDRTVVVPSCGFSKNGWSAFAGKPLAGSVHRVVLRGQTVYLDGSYFGEAVGRDITSVVRLITSKSLGAVTATPGRRGTTFATPLGVGGTLAIATADPSKTVDLDRMLGLVKSPQRRVFPVSPNIRDGAPTTVVAVPGSVTAVDGATTPSGGPLASLLGGSSLSNVKELATELEVGEDGIPAETPGKQVSKAIIQKSLNTYGAQYISELPRYVLYNVFLTSRAFFFFFFWNHLKNSNLKIVY